jgi:predicted metal-binding membrane protein
LSQTSETPGSSPPINGRAPVADLYTIWTVIVVGAILPAASGALTVSVTEPAAAGADGRKMATARPWKVTLVLAKKEETSVGSPVPTA